MEFTVHELSYHYHSAPKLVHVGSQRFQENRFVIDLGFQSSFCESF